MRENPPIKLPGSLDGISVSHTDDGARLLLGLQEELKGDELEVEMFYGEHVRVVISGFSDHSVSDAVKARVKRVVGQVALFPVEVVFSENHTAEGKDLKMVSKLMIAGEEPEQRE